MRKWEISGIILGIAMSVLLLSCTFFLTSQPVEAVNNETSTYCNVTVNYIIDASISNVPIVFNSLNPGTSDNQPSSGGWPTNVTVYSNTNTAWNLSIKASGDFSGADTIAISNLEFGNVSTLVETQMAITYQGPDNFINWNNEADPSSDEVRSIYFDMTVPSGQTAGDYSTTLYINVTQVT
jgi:hypothetical protein